MCLFQKNNRTFKKNHGKFSFFCSNVGKNFRKNTKLSWDLIKFNYPIPFFSSGKKNLNFWRQTKSEERWRLWKVVVSSVRRKPGRWLSGLYCSPSPSDSSSSPSGWCPPGRTLTPSFSTIGSAGNRGEEILNRWEG